MNDLRCPMKMNQMQIVMPAVVSTSIRCEASAAFRWRRIARGLARGLASALMRPNPFWTPFVSFHSAFLLIDWRSDAACSALPLDEYPTGYASVRIDNGARLPALLSILGALLAPFNTLRSPEQILLNHSHCIGYPTPTPTTTTVTVDAGSARNAAFK